MPRADDSGDDGWAEYGRLVLDRLDRLDRETTAIGVDVAAMRVDMGALKVKASVWGALAGLVPVVIALGIAIWRTGRP